MIFTVGLSVAIRMSLRWSATELERREAVKSRTEAELKNLRNQLNPHFLLNTLNNIYALTAFDTEKAQQAIQELSKLLRYVLYDNQETFVPLTKEVEFIQNYIELMRIRVSSAVKINTNFQIRPDSQSPVAPLLFISLIENAFKHGISPTEPSFIDITLTEKDDEIHCVIRNSNYPKNAMDKSGSGIGLEQVRKRLCVTNESILGFTASKSFSSGDVPINTPLLHRLYKALISFLVSHPIAIKALKSFGT